MAEPPIQTAFLAFAGIGLFLRLGRRDDDVIPKEGVVRPVRRDRDAFLIGKLEALHHTQELIEVAAQLRRVIEDRADGALGIDEEDGAHGAGAGAGMDQAQLLCHMAVIGDQGELDLGVEIVLDPVQPFIVLDAICISSPPITQVR